MSAKDSDYKPVFSTTSVTTEDMSHARAIDSFNSMCVIADSLRESVIMGRERCEKLERDNKQLRERCAEVEELERDNRQLRERCEELERLNESLNDDREVLCMRLRSMRNTLEGALNSVREPDVTPLVAAKRPRLSPQTDVNQNENLLERLKKIPKLADMQIHFSDDSSDDDSDSSDDDSDSDDVSDSEAAPMPFTPFRHHF